MSKLLVSIVTPSLNQAAYLPECLQSVASQGIPGAEHIVVDGASSDGSIAILQSFASTSPHLVKWSSQRDGGQSNALNKGFSQCSGDVIGWLNADDRYRAGCFEAVLEVFRRRPEIDVLYGDYTWINANGFTMQRRREISFSPFVLLYHRVLYIPTTAMFFRRRILDDGHLLDETLHYAMDFEFFVRLHQQGYRFAHVPVFLADFRFQPFSKTSLHPEKQLLEQSNVMRRYSPWLRHSSPPALAAGITFGLRTAAAVRRYSEKALRGYYFSQFSRNSSEA